MKGLIIKDILVLRKSLGTIVAMLPFYIFIAYISGDPSILTGMIVLVATMASITSISYDDFAKWDNYALATPISRKKMVISKYILSLLLSTLGLLVSTIIAYIIISLKGKMSVGELLSVSYVVYLIAILFSSILLPFIYKYGVEKSRLMMGTIIAVPMVIGYILVNMGVGLPNKNQFMTFLKVSPIIAIISIILSASISYCIYKKKDI